MKPQEVFSFQNSFSRAHKVLEAFRMIRGEHSAVFFPKTFQRGTEIALLT